MKYRSRAFADLLDNFPYKDVIIESRKHEDLWICGYFWSQLGYVLQPVENYPDEKIIKKTLINKITEIVNITGLMRKTQTGNKFLSSKDDCTKGENLNIKISNNLDYISVEYFNVKFIVDYRKKKENGTK